MDKSKICYDLFQMAPKKVHLLTTGSQNQRLVSLQ